MTNSTATVAQSWQFGLPPETAKKGVAVSFLHRLIPEGYEDSSGFHYGKVPPFVVLDTETCDKGIFPSESFKKINKAIAHAA